MLVPDDRVRPGMFYLRPQLQLIRSPKLKPCRLGSVNVTTRRVSSYREVPDTQASSMMTTLLTPGVNSISSMDVDVRDLT